MRNNAKKAFKLIVFLTAIIMATNLIGCSERPHSVSDGGNASSFDENSKADDLRNLDEFEYTKLSLSATDDYGRTLKPSDSEDKSRYVGIFFFLTLGYHANHSGIYDISKITDYGENIPAFFQNTAESPVGAAHFWGEPVWGYYRSDDPWVITKQVEMLTMAGLDFIALDVSNMILYEDTVDTLLEILLRFQQQGWDVPRVWFYCNQQNPETMDDKEVIKKIYNRWYTQKKYESLWFSPNGKPVVTQGWNTTWDIGNPLEKKIAETFEFRLRQWPTEKFNEEGIPWIEFTYPQPVHDGWINVSVAQHANTVAFSDCEKNWGRGYDFTTGVNDNEHFREGINFAQQWETVYKAGDQAKYVFITGWNEWVAEKMIYNGRIQTVDQFNEEYSRDIEPCVNGFGDNVYMQMIQNIRKWKYTDPVGYKNPSVTIDISSFDISQWADVKTIYRDFEGDAISRDWYSFDGSFSYVDTTNRNDIVRAYVCRDEEYLYFRVETKEPISEREKTDKKWMNLMIKTPDGGEDGIFGYQYFINREIEGNTTSVQKYDGKNYNTVGTGGVYVSGNVMQVRVKLSDLGLSYADYALEFKVTDNIKKVTDVLSYYKTGDSAPMGRMGYSFGYREEE